eukprot:CAMPEP_0170538734 /NCGR_PEP_ID=MMETSP0209-20121228/103491_1 /TAXON_ID=665100 ORGANISM="Litonotus pictus, Strain P1" /NCGR_SAMPLE_ID=MMETSP0209 /ASSEMBLY_ACC=CAM_ASM_000301 /LENGTH=2261 /DNA_ID=CAMNT_0010840497 /DNA_START=389 /DNA_END=7174 /DNA_ORIENTATION=+
MCAEAKRKSKAVMSSTIPGVFEKKCSCTHEEQVEDLPLIEGIYEEIGIEGKKARTMPYISNTYILDNNPFDFLSLVNVKDFAIRAIGNLSFTEAEKSLSKKFLILMNHSITTGDYSDLIAADYGFQIINTLEYISLLFKSIVNVNYDFEYLRPLKAPTENSLFMSKASSAFNSVNSSHSIPVKDSNIINIEGHQFNTSFTILDYVFNFQAINELMNYDLNMNLKLVSIIVYILQSRIPSYFIIKNETFELAPLLKISLFRFESIVNMSLDEFLYEGFMSNFTDMVVRSFDLRNGYIAFNRDSLVKNFFRMILIILNIRYLNFDYLRRIHELFEAVFSKANNHNTDLKTALEALSQLYQSYIESNISIHSSQGPNLNQENTEEPESESISNLIAKSLLRFNAEKFFIKRKKSILEKKDSLLGLEEPNKELYRHKGKDVIKTSIRNLLTTFQNKKKGIMIHHLEFILRPEIKNEIFNCLSLLLTDERNAKDTLWKGICEIRTKFFFGKYMKSSVNSGGDYSDYSEEQYLEDILLQTDTVKMFFENSEEAYVYRFVNKHLIEYVNLFEYISGFKGNNKVQELKKRIQLSILKLFELIAKTSALFAKLFVQIKDIFAKILFASDDPVLIKTNFSILETFFTGGFFKGDYDRKLVIDFSQLFKFMNYKNESIFSVWSECVCKLYKKIGMVFNKNNIRGYEQELLTFIISKIPELTSLRINSFKKENIEILKYYISLIINMSTQSFLTVKDHILPTEKKFNLIEFLLKINSKVEAKNDFMQKILSLFNLCNLVFPFYLNMETIVSIQKKKNNDFREKLQENTENKGSDANYEGKDDGEIPGKFRRIFTGIIETDENEGDEESEEKREAVTHTLNTFMRGVQESLNDTDKKAAEKRVSQNSEKSKSAWAMAVNSALVNSRTTHYDISSLDRIFDNYDICNISQDLIIKNIINFRKRIETEAFTYLIEEYREFIVKSIFSLLHFFLYQLSSSSCGDDKLYITSRLTILTIVYLRDILDKINLNNPDDLHSFTKNITTKFNIKTDHRLGREHISSSSHSNKLAFSLKESKRTHRGRGLGYEGEKGEDPYFAVKAYIVEMKEQTRKNLLEMREMNILNCSFKVLFDILNYYFSAFLEIKCEAPKFDKILQGFKTNKFNQPPKKIGEIELPADNQATISKKPHKTVNYSAQNVKIEDYDTNSRQQKVINNLELFYQSENEARKVNTNKFLTETSRNSKMYYNNIFYILLELSINAQNYGQKKKGRRLLVRKKSEEGEASEEERSEVNNEQDKGKLKEIEIEIGKENEEKKSEEGEASEEERSEVNNEQDKGKVKEIEKEKENEEEMLLEGKLNLEEEVDRHARPSIKESTPGNYLTPSANEQGELPRRQSKESKEAQMFISNQGLRASIMSDYNERNKKFKQSQTFISTNIRPKASFYTQRPDQAPGHTPNQSQQEEVEEIDFGSLESLLSLAQTESYYQFLQSKMISNSVRFAPKLIYLIEKEIPNLMQMFIIGFKSSKYDQDVLPKLSNSIEFVRLHCEGYNKYFQSFVTYFLIKIDEDNEITFVELLMKFYCQILQIAKQYVSKVKTLQVNKIFFKELASLVECSKVLVNFFIEITQGNFDINFIEIYSRDKFLPISIEINSLISVVLYDYDDERTEHLLRMIYDFLRLLSVLLEEYQSIQYASNLLDFINFREICHINYLSYLYLLKEMNLYYSDFSRNNSHPHGHFNIDKAEAFNQQLLSDNLRKQTYSTLGFSVGCVSFQIIKTFCFISQEQSSWLYYKHLPNNNGIFSIEESKIIKHCPDLFETLVKAVEITITKDNFFNNQEFADYSDYFIKEKFSPSYERIFEEVKDPESDYKYLIKVYFTIPQDGLYYDMMISIKWVFDNNGEDYNDNLKRMLNYSKTEFNKILNIKKTMLELKEEKAYNRFENYEENEKISLYFSVLSNILLISFMNQSNSSFSGAVILNNLSWIVVLFAINLAHIAWCGHCIYMYYYVKCKASDDKELMRKSPYYALTRIVTSDRTKMLAFNMCISLLSMFKMPYVLPFQLFSTYRFSSTLKILMFAIQLKFHDFIACLILIYFIVLFYSSVSLYFFANEVLNEQGERICSNFYSCSYYLNTNGYRTGLGFNFPIRSMDDQYYWKELIADWTFYFILILIMANIINAIVVDLFQKISEEEEIRFNFLTKTCMMCGLKEVDLKMKKMNYEQHVTNVHHIYFYLQYFHFLRQEKDIDLSRSNMKVKKMVEADSIQFFPTNHTAGLDKSNDKQ